MKRCPELTDVTRNDSYGATGILKLSIKLAKQKLRKRSIFSTIVALQVFERAS